MSISVDEYHSNEDANAKEIKLFVQSLFDLLTDLSKVDKSKDNESFEDLLAYIDDKFDQPESSGKDEALLNYFANYDKKLINDEIFIFEHILRERIYGDNIFEIDNIEFCGIGKKDGLYKVHGLIHYKNQSPLDIRLSIGEREVDEDIGSSDNWIIKTMIIGDCDIEKDVNEFYKACSGNLEKLKNKYANDLIKNFSLYIDGVKELSTCTQDTKSRIDEFVRQLKFNEKDKIRQDSIKEIKLQIYRDSIIREQEKLLAEIAKQDSIKRIREQKTLDSLQQIRQIEIEERVKNSEIIARADVQFNKENYEEARRIYKLVSRQELVTLDIYKCNNCITAIVKARKGDGYMKDNKLLTAYSYYAAAYKLCPTSLSIGSKYQNTQIRLVNKYLKSAQKQIDEGDVSKALILVGRALEFDRTNKLAQKMASEYKKYNDPSFIRSEIARAKKLAFYGKENDKEYAEIFRILYRYRDAYIYMDGDTYYLLAMLKRTPNKYGLNKSINLSTYKIKSKWKDYYEKSYCKCSSYNTKCHPTIVRGLSNAVDEKLFTKKTCY